MEPRENLLQLRPLGPAEIFDASLVTLLAAPWLFVGIAAVAAAVPLVAASLLKLVALYVGSQRPGVLQGVWLQVTGISDILSVYVAFCFGASWIARAGLATWMDATVSPGEIIRRPTAGHHSLATISAFTVPWIPVFLLHVPETHGALQAGRIILLVLAYIVAITVSIGNSLGLVVTEAEGQRGFKALRRSRQLLRANGWWRSLMTYVLVFLMAGIVILALSMGRSALIDVLPEGTRNVLGVLISFVVDLIGTTLVIAVVTLVPLVAYFDARVRREALDIELLLDAAGAPR